MLGAGFASRTFIALENPQFRLLWLGTLFSFLGMQMQVIARGYLAYDLTGRNGALGLVMIGFGLPQLFLGLWGGVIADRLPKRKVLWVSQSIIALNSAWLAVMIITGHVEFWMLVFASVVQGAGFAFVGPARQAYIGDIVGRDRIGNAIVLQQMSMNSTRVVGPALAGGFIAVTFIGVGGVYLMTSLGFVVAMVTMAWLPPGNPAPRKVQRSPLADLRDGLSYVRQRPAISNLILVSFAVVMVGFPYQAFLPSIAAEMYNVGSGGLGFLASATAVGALFATLMVASRAGSPGAWGLSALCGVGFGASLVVLGFTGNYLFGLLAMVLVGGFAAGFQSLNNSLTMTYTDDEYHGRVQSMTMLSWSFFGIFSLPLGILADHIGVAETLMLMGCVSILSIVGMQIVGKKQGVAADRIKTAAHMVERQAQGSAGGGAGGR